MTSLFQFGSFKSHSGLNLLWKIDCDALDFQELNNLIVGNEKLIPLYSEVVGIPRGGIRIADRIRQLIPATPDAKMLVVDDVMTTGKSMVKWMEDYNANGFILFDRCKHDIKNVSRIFKVFS